MAASSIAAVDKDATADNAEVQAGADEEKMTRPIKTRAYGKRVPVDGRYRGQTTAAILLYAQGNGQFTWRDLPPLCPALKQVLINLAERGEIRKIKRGGIGRYAQPAIYEKANDQVHRSAPSGKIERKGNNGKY